MILNVFKRVSSACIFLSMIFSLITSSSSSQSEEDIDVNNWKVRGGLGLYIKPKYIGSDEAEILFIPIIDVSYKERYFFNLDDGVGMHLYRGENATIKTSLGYEFGRKSSDDDSLATLDDIDDSVTAKLSFEYKMGSFTPYLSIQKFTDGTEGVQAYIGVERLFLLGQNPYKDPSLLVDISIEQPNEKHMREYYGISDEQAIRSGYNIYSPGSGLSAANLGISYIRPLSNRLVLITHIEYLKLLDEASDSPLVLDNSQISGGVLVSYSF